MLRGSCQKKFYASCKAVSCFITTHCPVLHVPLTGLKEGYVLCTLITNVKKYMEQCPRCFPSMAIRLLSRQSC
jgi:hypothetical protein